MDNKLLITILCEKAIEYLNYFHVSESENIAVIQLKASEILAKYYAVADIIADIDIDAFCKLHERTEEKRKELIQYKKDFYKCNKHNRNKKNKQGQALLVGLAGGYFGATANEKWGIKSSPLKCLKDEELQFLVKSI